MIYEKFGKKLTHKEKIGDNEKIKEFFFMYKEGILEDCMETLNIYMGQSFLLICTKINLILSLVWKSLLIV